MDYQYIALIILLSSYYYENELLLYYFVINVLDFTLTYLNLIIKNAEIKSSFWKLVAAFYISNGLFQFFGLEQHYPYLLIFLICNTCALLFFY